MPRRDGTGPIGRGPMTGRGYGFCGSADSANYSTGFGLGCRRGFGRGFGRFFGRGFGRGFGRYLDSNVEIEQVPGKISKELLQEQKNFLKSELEAIEKELEEL